MKCLYNRCYKPISDTLALFEAPAGAVEHALSTWLNRVGRPPGMDLSVRRISGALSTLFDHLPPLNNVLPMRRLLVPTASKWSAYFDNEFPYSACDTMAPQVCRLLGCRTIRVAAQPKDGGPHAATILDLYASTQPDSYSCERSIYVVCEDGEWKFDQYGPPYPFEKLEQYRVRRIKDRFTVELMDEYLQHFGIRAFDEEFYQATPENPAFLLELVGPVPPHVQQVSLEEYR